MRVPVSGRDRRIWAAAITLSLLMSGMAARPAAACYCCCPDRCCYERSEVLFAPAPPASEEATISWSYIDPIYILTRVLIPIIYASLIIRIIWLIQRN